MKRAQAAAWNRKNNKQSCKFPESKSFGQAFWINEIWKFSFPFFSSLLLVHTPQNRCVSTSSVILNPGSQKWRFFLDDDKLLPKYWWFGNQPIKKGGWTSRKIIWMIPTWGYIPGSRKYSHVIIIIVVITIIILIHQSFILRPKYRTHLNFSERLKKTYLRSSSLSIEVDFVQCPSPAGTRNIPKITDHLLLGTFNRAKPILRVAG